MSAFPPNKWDVRFLQDMDTLECAPREDGGLAMEAYIAVRPAGVRKGTSSWSWGATGSSKSPSGWPDYSPERHSAT